MNDDEIHIRLAQSMVRSVMDDVAAGKHRDDVILYNTLNQIFKHIEEGLDDRDKREL